jgi:hypothetical protein
MNSRVRLLTTLTIALLIAVIAFIAGYQKRRQIEAANQLNMISGPPRIPLGIPLDGPETNPPRLPGAPK